MQQAIEQLFANNSPLAVIIFIFLILYFMQDMVKKSQRIDRLLEQLISVNNDIHSIKNLLTVEQNITLRTQKDMEELKKTINAFSNKLIKIETKIQLKELEMDQEHDQ